MKRALFLALLLSQMAFADTFTPQWEEFCPPEFLEVQPVTVPRHGKEAYLPTAFIPIVNFAALPFAMRAERKKTEAIANNYWASRRLKFENELALCDQTEGDRALCYMQIRQTEEQKNQAYQQSLDMKKLRRAVYSRLMMPAF